MASEALTHELRAGWLQLARDWLSMVPSYDRTEHEDFDAATHEQGTGQNDSIASH